jgi:16S rRNA A1518/A1519 N6-dimethyltransferase RsmA/KsgA/DIM1 with predicted DNA glycosylase/AP lyase activity
LRNKRQRLGQHFLRSERALNALIDSARLEKSDLVFEIGTGTGLVTGRIAPKVKKIVSCEKDHELYQEARHLLAPYHNVELLEGNAFRMKQIPNFDVCITSLPYSQSLEFIEWLAARAGTFRCASALVQEDFAMKLFARPPSAIYRPVSVVAQLSFKIQEKLKVPRESFDPPPKVNSVILSFETNEELKQPFFTKESLLRLKTIFSFRGRLLRNAFQEPDRRKISEELIRKRVEELEPMEFAALLQSVK